MQIAVSSKSGARDRKHDKPWACISISSDPTQYPVLHEENLQGWLRLCFLDVNHHLIDIAGTDPLGLKGISGEQALQILEFVDKHISDVDLLLVHCEMGMSRSPGVAAAVYKVFTGLDDGFWFDRYTPNTRVYNTILKVAQGDPRFNEFLVQNG
jgi:predicted protein tyrosine phosphatase